MAQQMESLIFIRIVCFLEYGNIVGSALVEISVFVSVDRIYFKTYHAEILSCQFAGFTDILHIAFLAAFACEDKDLFHAAFCKDLHFVFHLFH